MTPTDKAHELLTRYGNNTGKALARAKEAWETWKHPITDEPFCHTTETFWDEVVLILRRKRDIETKIALKGAIKNWSFEMDITKTKKKQEHEQVK